MKLTKAVRREIRLLIRTNIRDKHPICIVNEVCQMIGAHHQYIDFMKLGQDHLPVFGVLLEVADLTFEGWGHSKREARAAAARACLTALLARAGRVLASGDTNNDFTQDVLPKNDDTSKRPSPAFQCTEKLPVEKKIEVSSSPASPALSNDECASSALFGTAQISASFAKSPINLLYENYPGLNFTCTFGDGSPLVGPQAPLQLSHSMRFKVVCQIKDQIYEGYGSSKKLAKLAAARAALAVLKEGTAEPRASPTPYGALPQVLADHVSKIVNEKFNELMKHDLIHSKRKVLAGIVISIEDKVEGSKIIAVTTGTKCVSGEHMSVRGRAVNDCHAEVAARRCLQRHLYAQLLEYARQSNPRAPIESSDIEPCPGGGYQLKPSRRIHLYVSTAPCGDGRIFSPHEHREPAPDPHPNRQARGQLRTKIESGEGTIPVKSNSYVQTWDGVMQGERLLTMSCSDKVARWCVLGLQGALLSRVLRPVYLHSLVLGSLLHPHHMYRALCGRIESHMSALPWPYSLHRPLLARAASTEARTPARAPSFSVCWSHTSPAQPEILNAMTGKLENGQPSLLCKQTMFARWHYLVNKLEPLQHQSLDLESKLPAIPENPSTLLYSEAKMLCPGYQTAKKCLFDAFESANLGKWVKKPLEQDEFCCEIVDPDPKHLFAWAGDHLRYNTMQNAPNDVSGLEYGRNDYIDDVDGLIDDVSDTNAPNDVSGLEYGRNDYIDDDGGLINDVNDWNAQNCVGGLEYDRNDYIDDDGGVIDDVSDSNAPNDVSGLEFGRNYGFDDDDGLINDSAVIGDANDDIDNENDAFDHDSRLIEDVDDRNDVFDDGNDVIGDANGEINDVGDENERAAVKATNFRDNTRKMLQDYIEFRKRLHKNKKYWQDLNVDHIFENSGNRLEEDNVINVTKNVNDRETTLNDTSDKCISEVQNSQDVDTSFSNNLSLQNISNIINTRSSNTDLENNADQRNSHNSEQNPKNKHLLRKLELFKEKLDSLKLNSVDTNNNGVLNQNDNLKENINKEFVKSNSQNNSVKDITYKLRKMKIDMKKSTEALSKDLNSECMQENSVNRLSVNANSEYKQENSANKLSVGLNSEYVQENSVTALETDLNLEHMLEKSKTKVKNESSLKALESVESQNVRKISLKKLLAKKLSLFHIAEVDPG